MMMIMVMRGECCSKTDDIAVLVMVNTGGDVDGVCGYWGGTVGDWNGVYGNRGCDNGDYDFVFDNGGNS